MRTITETKMLLRNRLELPVGLKLATAEFREGWNFVKTVNAARLEKRIRSRGWSFVKIADGSIKSGVGETSQEAIASALKLAVRQVSEHCNAVAVDHIELTEYPWFFLARVLVNPCRIQESAILPAGEARLSQSSSRERRLPANSASFYPNFGSAMPILRELLISTQGLEERSL